MASVTYEHVTKRFGDVVAVNDLDIHVEDKEFLVLLGPSGCGKTTTLRLLAGLEEITEGNIYIGDRLVNDVPPKDRDIAMVFQSYALYPHMKVFDERRYSNLNFALKIRKYMSDKIRRVVSSVAEDIGIERKLFNRLPHELSHGEKQKVAVGRAMTIPPKVFLMDEPMSNLDPPSRVKMMGEIKRIHNELRTTTIYVTQNLVEGMAMADRLAVMKEGTIQQVGTPEEIRNHPVNEFVADFIKYYDYTAQFQTFRR